MKRFAALSVFALILGSASFGFASVEQDGKAANEVTINVSSESGRALFEAHFETESALSIATEDGITPMTFTAEAESFSGVVRPKGNSSIKVEVTREGPDAVRTSDTPTRIVKDGGDISLTGAKPE